MKILVIRNDKLGDFVQAFPAFAMLKASNPELKLTALVPAYTAPLAQICPYLDNVIIDSAKNDKADFNRLVKEIKEQQFDGMISFFSNAHNQYLDDLSKRGIVGLLALLAVLFIPLRSFMKNLKTANNEIKLIATLGIAHILSVMIYGLSQGFLVHNSGTIFYFFLTIVFYTAIRTQQKAE